jgi:hypothetical protein
MKTGKLNIQGSLQADTWERIFDTTLVAAATSVTISGLHGDTDEEYELEARIVNGYNGAASYLVRCNNDTGSNYGSQNLAGENSTVSASRDSGALTSWFFGYGSALNNLNQSEMLISAKSGYVRTAINEHTDSIVTTTVGRMYLRGQSWNNTADEITSLVVLANQANGLGVGTQITLWRKIKKA